MGVFVLVPEKVKVDPEPKLREEVVKSPYSLSKTTVALDVTSRVPLLSTPLEKVTSVTEAVRPVGIITGTPILRFGEGDAPPVRAPVMEAPLPRVIFTTVPKSEMTRLKETALESIFPKEIEVSIFMDKVEVTVYGKVAVSTEYSG